MTVTQTNAAYTYTPRRPRVLAGGARALISMREEGHHPRFAVVVVGARYVARRYTALAAHLGAPAPLMALTDEIEARALSWYPVRGLAVVLCNADGDALRRALLLEAIAQLASEAAPVLLFSGGDIRDPDSCSDDATDLLFDARFEDADGRWPPGWNSAKHRDYGARVDRWCAETPA